MVTVVLSFTISAIYWVLQQQRFAMTASLTPRQTWLHLVFLFLIVLIPISASLPDLVGSGASRVTVMIYGVRLLLIALLNLLLWVEVHRVIVAHEKIVRSSLSLAMFVVALGVGLMRLPWPSTSGLRCSLPRSLLDILHHVFMKCACGDASKVVCDAYEANGNGLLPDRAQHSHCPRAGSSRARSISLEPGCHPRSHIMSLSGGPRARECRAGFLRREPLARRSAHAKAPAPGVRWLRFSATSRRCPSALLRTGLLRLPLNGCLTIDVDRLARGEIGFSRSLAVSQTSGRC